MLGLAVAACSPAPRDAGLTLRQSVVIAGTGTPAERRLQVFEDARITPAMRALMWGGSKDAAEVLRQPGIDISAADRDALRKNGFVRGALRLIDRDGAVLDERRLDCELGEIAEPAIPQGSGLVWGVGDDCSTGGGDFAGLITRFLMPGGDKIRFETYDDGDPTNRLELTLVTADRIRWHLAPRGIAGTVHEISSHPDYDDPRFKTLRPGEPPPAELPWVVDYLTYHWDPLGVWHKSVRTETNRQWRSDEAWPADDAFPAPG